ncbi:MAG: sigma-70 family RNA polymerase sigma factor [Cyclobacteriaceae bacterium]|nr:sigma-70 family RNA polymerase sigma factor [Cyclobacteriaceae bacterium]
MKKDYAISTIDFEFLLFELISENKDINSPHFNHQLHKLFLKYKPNAIKVARQYHLQEEMADDVLQEGVLLLINRIKDGKFEYNVEYKLGSFLNRTFRNLSSNFSRKYNRNIETHFWCQSGDRLDGDICEMDATSEIAQNRSLPDVVRQIIQENLSPQGARILNIGLLCNKSNAEGADIMHYKDESIFRKKKSQNLAKLRNAITPAKRHELMRMAS